MSLYTEFEIFKKGFKHIVTINSMTGFRCGYVGIPKGHLFYEAYLGHIEAHGGITYEGHLRGDEDYWYLGFDCGHFGDRPDVESCERYFGDEFDPSIIPDFGSGVLRDLQFCINEVQSIFNQLMETEGEFNDFLEKDFTEQKIDLAVAPWLITYMEDPPFELIEYVFIENVYIFKYLKKKDLRICREAVRSAGFELGHVPEGLRTESICDSALRSDPRAIGFVPRVTDDLLREYIQDLSWKWCRTGLMEVPPRFKEVDELVVALYGSSPDLANGNIIVQGYRKGLTIGEICARLHPTDKENLPDKYKPKDPPLDTVLLNTIII